jgi:CRP-like cAMP-binding protein
MAENLLLAALPREERQRLDPFLDPVTLNISDVLIEANEPIRHMYFPYDCVTSTLQGMSDGTTIEVGMMGIEGLIGIQLWLHSRTTPTRTIVQVSGRGLQMRASDFIREVMERPSPLNDLVARYTHAFLVMTSQVAACNRLHTVEVRLCRWLSLIYNRIRRNEFALRQEFIAQMLGVHRPSVSIAAGVLQKAGLISYNRGQMLIVDPEGLREGACECLGLMEVQFDAVFGRPWRELADEQDQR